MFKHYRFGAVLAAIVVTLAWASTATAASMISVSGAWMRPTPVGAGGAAYLTITNHGAADTLVAVRSPDAARASIHQSRMVGQVMTMRALPSLAIKAGAAVHLAPAGLHVMVEGVNRPLKPGDRITLVLTFAKAGRMRLKVPVRADAPVDPMAGMKM